MAVIREDVVSIGFDVASNPFQDLTAGINSIRAQLGILDSAESGLSGVGEAANGAASQIDGLVDSIRPPPGSPLAEPIRDADEAAGRTRTTFTELCGEMRRAAQQNLTDGVERLTTGIRRPLTGFRQLTERARNLSRVRLADVPRALNAGLGSALTGASRLMSKLKAMASVGLNKLVSGVKSLATHAGKAAKSLGGKAFSGLKSLGKGALVGIAAGSVALVGMGTAAVAVGAGFETSMSQVAATMGMTADEASYSNAEYAKLANTAKEMGASTKFSASESAEALNYMALAGYDADKSCAALPTVLNLAASGGMELAAASDMVTDSMSALGIEATQENLTQFGDQLAKAAQKSNTSVAQLGEAVLTVGGTAKTLAGGTTELNTMLGILADNGVKGADGGTALRNIMLSLQTPTDAAAKKMKSLGLSVYDTQGKMRPMNEVLGDLNESIDGMTDQQKQDAMATIFNKTDLKSVNALLANSGGRFDELSGYINNSAGAMENMANTMHDNLTGRVTEFKSAAEGAGIAIYEALGSSNMKGLVEEATGWITELTKATETGGFEGLVGQMGTTLSNVLTTVVGYLPDLVDGGISIIDSLIEGITSNQDGIVQSLTKGLTSLSKGILKIAPKLLIAGAEMLTSLAKGSADAMPQLIPVALEAIQTLSQGLLANVPLLIESAISILNSLITGLLQAAPLIVSSGVQLIQSLVMGLLNSVDLIINGAVNLILALATGILSNIPLIIEAAVQLITGFVNGIVNNINLIIDGALALVEGLLTGIIDNLPAIIQGAVQIVVALAGGLIQAIPALIAAIPRIVDAIINTLMNTDWLKLGGDIIKGIGSGLTSGLKGLFGKGKDAGNEVNDGVVAGVTESTDQLALAADTTTAIAATSMKPNTSLLHGYGMQMPTAMASGIQDGTAAVQVAADEINHSTVDALAGIADETQPSLANVSSSFSQTLGDMDTSAATNMTKIDTTVQTGFTGMVSDAGTFRSDFTSEIDQTNLYQSGVNIMQGLDNGMLSMRNTLMVTARGIATGVKNEVNSTLDIHSPSRVMEDSGEDTGLGLVKGLKNLAGKVSQTAQGIGNQTAKDMSPMRSRYSPESASVSNSRSTTSNQTNSYAPVFHLTLNGASASDSNERKVKRWVKEAWKGNMESMERSNPRVQEV